MESIENLLQKVLGHYEKKEYASAEKLADALVASNPKFHRGWFLKAVILEETGRSDEAEKCYQKAGNLFTMFFRLALQLQDSDPQRALVYYEKVSDMDQRNNMLWLNKGLLYEKMGRVNEAKACFRNLSPVREVISRIVMPSVFMIFLAGALIATLEQGNKTIALLVVVSAVFCFFLLKRDTGAAVKMLLKKKQSK